MKYPVHPGSLIKEDCINALGISVTEAAERLGVNRTTLSRLINERIGVSAEMAVRLEKVFGSTAETWLRLQMNHDLARVRQRESLELLSGR